MNLYKIYFLFVSLNIILVTLTNAQGFGAGVIAGLNGSQITGDNMRGFDKGGILAGVFSEYHFNKNRHLRVELNFTQKGSRKVVDLQTGTAPGMWLNRKITYLEVPVMYRYNAEKWLEYMGISNDHIFVSGGVAVAYRIAEKVIYNDGTVDYQPRFSTRLEGSFLLGGEYYINPSLTAFIRYQSSLYDISVAKASPFWQIWGERHKGYINVVTSIGIRYYFSSSG